MPKIGERVIALRLSLNLGSHGVIGEMYEIINIAPKVRVTKGTGRDFIVGKSVRDGGLGYFNFADVKKIHS